MMVHDAYTKQNRWLQWYTQQTAVCVHVDSSYSITTAYACRVSENLAGNMMTLVLKAVVVECISNECMVVPGCS